jgi:hypothetical protein
LEQKQSSSYTRTASSFGLRALLEQKQNRRRETYKQLAAAFLTGDFFCMQHGVTLKLAARCLVKT